jgi:hypothetical protein
MGTPAFPSWARGTSIVEPAQPLFDVADELLLVLCAAVEGRKLGGLLSAQAVPLTVAQTLPIFLPTAAMMMLCPFFPLNRP